MEFNSYSPLLVEMEALLNAYYSITLLTTCKLLKNIGAKSLSDTGEFSQLSAKAGIG